MVSNLDIALEFPEDSRLLLKYFIVIIKMHLGDVSDLVD